MILPFYYDFECVTPRQVPPDTRSPMMRVLEILEPLDEVSRDRLLFGLLTYFGHEVEPETK